MLEMWKNLFIYLIPTYTTLRLPAHYYVSQKSALHSV